MKETLINEVAVVMIDGSRTDRYLERGVDGELFVTTQNLAVEQFEIVADFDSDGSDSIENAAELIAEAENRL